MSCCLLCEPVSLFFVAAHRALYYDYYLSVARDTEARQIIPERSSSGTAGALSTSEIKDVCGGAARFGICAGAAGLYMTEVRNGFPEDMLKTKNNALFYVHGKKAPE
jgi:hypothetical protein